MVLPNFLIIGSAKSGTTSIAQYLNQHPQIYISPIKEPFFFSFQEEKIDFCGPGDHLSLRLAVNNLESYEKLFDGVSSETSIGEASTSYLYTPQAAKRIYNRLPNVKLIAVLRHPVDKAYSSFLHQLREGYEPLTDFSEALRQENRRIQSNWMYFWHYRNNGFYYSKLKRYYDLFPREQIKVYLYDDFRKNPYEFIKNILNFLDVDGSFVPDLSVKYNISGIPRSRLFYNLITKNKFVKKSCKLLVPRSFRQKVRSYSLAKPELPEDLRQSLLSQYQEDIVKLQNLIRRDLSLWLT